MQNSNSAHPDPSQASEDAGHKTVRRATIADAVTVRELTRAAYAKWVPLLGREPRPMTADYDAAVRDHLIDLLHVGGEAVALIAGRVPTEASGGVNLQTIRAIAETGVTYISVGRITQSAPAADIGLDFA